MKNKTQRCKTCGHEIEPKMETMKIKEFNLEITKPITWTKTFGEIVIPKGFRLFKLWELWRLLESKYGDEFLGEFKGQCNYFFCEQTKYAKKKNFLSGLYLYGVLDLYSISDSLAGSSGSGRVAFCRDLKEKK